MVVFIDESGIHKQEGHSTTAVVYVEVSNLEKFTAGLIKLEKNLRISHFHWTEERWLMREKFLAGIMDLNFSVKIAIFQNPVNSLKMIEAVLQHLITEPKIRNIFIDGKKPRWYEQKMKKVLRDKGISVKKLKTVRNEVSEPGIQLADALAGLSRYYFDNPEAKEAKKWMGKLQRSGKLFAQIVFGAGSEPFLK
jgi:hypothetical protein